jgi:Ca-activated chloride channel family protein
MGNRALIIFTDGEELSGDAVKEAGKAAEAGVKIFTVGVGTAQGSLIPLAGKDEGGFVKDAKGQVVKSKRDRASDWRDGPAFGERSANHATVV